MSSSVPAGIGCCLGGLPGPPDLRRMLIVPVLPNLALSVCPGTPCAALMYCAPQVSSSPSIRRSPLPLCVMHGHDMSLVSALFEFTHNLVTVFAVVGRSYVAAEVDDDGLVGGQLDGGVQAVAGVAVGAVVGCAVVGRSGA